MPIYRDEKGRFASAPTTCQESSTPQFLLDDPDFFVEDKYNFLEHIPILGYINDYNQIVFYAPISSILEESNPTYKLLAQKLTKLCQNHTRFNVTPNNTYFDLTLLLGCKYIKLSNKTSVYWKPVLSSPKDGITALSNHPLIVQPYPTVEEVESCLGELCEPFFNLKEGCDTIITNKTNFFSKSKVPLIPRFTEVKVNSKAPKNLEAFNLVKLLISYKCNWFHYIKECQLGLTQFSNIYKILNNYSTKVTAKLDTTIVIPDVPTFKPPILSEEKQKQLLTDVSCDHSYNNGWIFDLPTKNDFDDVAEMYDKVMEHCKHIPDFKIISLRKRRIAYRSDGTFALTPDCITKPDSGYHLYANFKNPYIPQESLYVAKKPLAPDHTKMESCYINIYCGDAWNIQFTFFGDQDPLKNNIVYFATPEQYVEGMSQSRPDLVENFEPWSDIMFICSNWCERNGSWAKSQGLGIDLQTPNRKRQSLATWILGPCLSKFFQEGGKITSGCEVYSPAWVSGVKQKEILEAAQAKLAEKQAEEKILPKKKPAPKKKAVSKDAFMSASIPESSTSINDTSSSNNIATTATIDLELLEAFKG